MAAVRLALADSVPAAGGELGEALMVSFSAQPGPLPCSAAEASRPPALTDIEVVLDGADTAPVTLAGFLAPWTERVEILLPDAGSVAGTKSLDHNDLAEAALRITAGVTHQLREPGVVVDVHGGQPSGLLSPFTRVIAIRPDNVARLALEQLSGRTVMTVRGPAGGLGDVADLPGSAALAQAAVPTLVVQPMLTGSTPTTTIASAAGPTEAPTNLTLAALGMRSITRQGRGSAEVGLFGLVPELGAVPSSVAIELRGRVLSDSGARKVRVSLLAGGLQLAARTVTAGDVFRLRGTAEGSGQGSATPYMVRAAAVDPPVGACGQLPLVTLSLDASTSVQAAAGGRSTDGFGAFPQVLRSRLDVAIGDRQPSVDDPAGTGAITAAAAVVAQLQQVALPRLAVRVVTWPRTADGTPGLEQRWSTLQVAPSSAQELVLRPPLGLSPLTIDIGSTLVGRGDGASLAAVEVLSAGSARHLLLTTGGSTRLLARLGAQLQQRPSGWFDLNGRVLLSDGTRLTAVVAPPAPTSGATAGTGGPSPPTVAEAMAPAGPGRSGRGWTAFVVGALLAAGALVMVTAARRWRNR